MPSVGDVIVRFLGDTTQLDSSFDQVDARQKQSSTTAAASAIELKAAQAELRAAMAATTAQGGQNADNMDRLSAAEERVAIAANAAKEAQLALKESLGIGTQQETAFAEAAGEVTGKLGSMLALMAVAEGIKSWVEHVQEGVLELQKLSEKTGVNITTLAGLEHMAERTGVPFEKLSTAMVRMQNAQVLAVEGSKKQQQAFQNLGISVDELRHLTPEELFFKVGEAIAKTGNHALATNSAMTLFGRGAADLNVIFQDYAGHLQKTAEEEGRLTGVTDEAGRSAKEWKALMADLTNLLRSNTIPVMQGLIPVFKTIASAGSFVTLAIRDIASTVGALAITMIDRLAGIGQAVSAVAHGNFGELGKIARQTKEQTDADMQSIAMAWHDNAQKTHDTLNELWHQQLPKLMSDAKDDLSDLAVHDKKATQSAAAEAKSRMEANVAAIDHDRALLKQALAEKAIDINHFVEMDIALTAKERKTKDDYYRDLIELYKKDGDAAKMKETQDARNADAAKAATKSTTEQTAVIKSLEEQTRKYGITAASVYGKLKTDADDALTPVELMDKKWKTFIPQWVQQATLLRNTLKSVGVEGLDTMSQKLKQAELAEKLLNDAGIKGGKIWLEVQAAKLKAIVAIAQASGKSATQEIQQLHRIENELKKFDIALKNTSKSFAEMTQEMKQDIGQFSIDLGDSLAAAVQGTVSAGQAIEQAVGKMIGNMAKHWAQYFAALAIADMWSNPAKAGAELAAAAALEVLGAVASSLGGGSNTGSSGSGQSGGGSASASVGAPAGKSGGVNVPHMAGGGLVMGPTLLMAGDARSAGSSSDTEAIIPLHNREAVDQIAEAISARMGSHGSGVTVHVGGMVSPDNLNKVVRQINRQVGRRAARLTSGTTFRLTKRG